MPAIDDLGIPGDELDPGPLGSSRHRLDDDAELGHGQALLEDEAGTDVAGLGASHRNVVDGSVDRQLADIAARKEARPDDERIRRDRDALGWKVEDRGVGELTQLGSTEGGHQQVLDQLGGQLAAAAVAQHDVRVVAKRQRARPVVDAAHQPAACTMRP